MFQYAPAENSYQILFHTFNQNYFQVGTVVLTAVDFHSWHQRSDYSNGVFDLYLLETSATFIKSRARCQNADE